MTIKTYREVVREVLAREMERDERVVLIGENLCGSHGGNVSKEAKIEAFGDVLDVTKGSWTQFGSDRVIDIPITGLVTIDTAVGAAVTGLWLVTELMFMDFSSVSYDALYDQAVKFRYMFGGRARAPPVMRGMISAGFSAVVQYLQSSYSILTITSGLKVVAPSTPYDVKGLLIQFIRDGDPVVFCEHKMLYDLRDEMPDEIYIIPLGVANYAREGGDITITTLSTMVHKTNQVADKLAREGISAEVVGSRTIPPLDEEGILESVAPMRRAVIVDESAVRFGFAHDAVALITSRAFHSFKTPVLLATPSHMSVPLLPTLEKLWILGVECIEVVTHQVLEDQPASEIKVSEMPKWGLSMEEGLLV